MTKEQEKAFRKILEEQILNKKQREKTHKDNGDYLNASVIMCERCEIEFILKVFNEITEESNK